MNCLIDQDKIDLLDRVKERRRNYCTNSEVNGSIHGPRSLSPITLGEMARFASPLDPEAEHLPNSCMQRVSLKWQISDTSPIDVQFDHETSQLIVKFVNTGSDSVPGWIAQAIQRIWGQVRTESVSFAPSPDIEKILIHANRLEAIGEIDQGMDHVYEAFDDLLHAEGLSRLDSFIVNFDADSCTPHVLLAFLTVLGMSRHELKHWQLLVHNLADAEVVKDHVELGRILDRFRAQL